MSAKAVVFVIVQAVFIKCVLSQSINCAAFPAGLGLNAPYGLSTSALSGPAFTSSSCAANGLAYNGRFDGLAANLAGNNFAYDGIYAPAIEITSTSGGALPIASASPIPPVGIAIESDNAYEGALAVAGELPFVGTVGLEGLLPSAGSGAVNHACGNGMTRMVSQNAGLSSPAAVSAFGPGAVSGGAFAPAGFLGQNVGGLYGSMGSAIAPATSVSPFGYNNGLAGINNFPAAYPAGLAGPYGLGAGLGYDGLAYPAAGYAAGLAPYGGAGEGNVAVAGELPVAGNTAVAGQVPIMGSVGFNGVVPAAGAVSIIGQCACTCAGPYLY